MNCINLLIKRIFVLFLIAFGLVSPAQSGGLIDELPVVIIENRTNELPSDSLFYNMTFPKAKILFYFQEPNEPLTNWGPRELPAVDPGVIDEFPIAWPVENFSPSPNATIYWSYYGGVIDELPIYAFPYGTSEVDEKPLLIPILELGKAGEPLADPRPTPLFGFASPGILAGEATFMTVPEPSLIVLLGISVLSLAGLRRWWKE